MQHAAARKGLPSSRKNPRASRIVQFAGLALAVIDGGGAYGSRAARRTWFALLGQKAFLKRVAITLLTLGAGADPWHFMLQPKVRKEHSPCWISSTVKDLSLLATCNLVHRVFPKSESSLESSQECRHTTCPVQTSPARSELHRRRGQNLQQR